MAGPLVGWIVRGLEGAVVVGGLSTLGACLYSAWASPRTACCSDETALKTGKFVLIVHGSVEEATQAQQIIKNTNPETLETHQPSH